MINYMAPATASNSTITPVTAIPSGIMLNANGTFDIAPGTLPGAITFYYKVCTSLTSCSADIFCEIAIHSTLRGYNDAVTATAAPNGVIVYNILSNDVYMGDCSSTGTVPATLSNVHLTSVVDDPPYYSINQATGVIQYSLNTPISSGTHLLEYTICDNVYNAICQTVRVVITVPVLKMSSNNANNSDQIFNIDATRVSPNPTTGKILITFNSLITNDYKLQLYDIIGRLLIEKHIPKNTLQYELDLSNYSSANYFIKLYDTIKEAIFYKTIIKQ
jgi:Secretion system C-terminal sorting domain